MTTKDKIGHIEDHFRDNPDECYLAWQGTYPIDNSFYRMNMVFAYVLGSHNGKVIARKIAGTSIKIDNTIKIIYSTDLWRATNKRNGRKRVVMADRIRLDESACPAGLVKNVESGSLPYQLSTRPGDVGLVDTLYNMVTADDIVVTEDTVRPLCYLCAYETEVYKPKPDAELINILKNSDKYDASESLDTNFRECFEESFTKLSNGRWLVNNNWVTGKGIFHIDLNSVYDVYNFKGNIEELDYEDDNFIFKVSSSLRW